ncbi:MAG: right-handed parallel beta-helix repeat-containing protein [Lachnospiraceae bacterium]|nr:right-handed parallel beta-helix repeat-containing protein [Lachnospiraceae bacterium]
MKKHGQIGKPLLALLLATALLGGCASAQDPAPQTSGGTDPTAVVTEPAAEPAGTGEAAEPAGTQTEPAQAEPAPAAPVSYADSYWHSVKPYPGFDGKDRAIELFLHADGTVMLREASYFEGRLYYDVEYSTENKWEEQEDGILVTFIQDWGEGEVDVEEIPMTLSGDTLSYTDTKTYYYEEGETPGTIELVRAEMPHLPNLAEDLPKLEGEWVLVATEGEGAVMDAAEMGVESKITVYRDGEDLKLDYEYDYEWDEVPESLKGLTVTGKEEPVYLGCANGMWSAELSGEGVEEGSRNITLLSDDELLYQRHGTYDWGEGEEYEDYGYVEYGYYLRVGSEAWENRDEYFYYDKVTVSNVRELAAAIGSHTKITLKEGVYNFSELLVEDDARNDHLEVEWWAYGGSWTINSVSYLLLEPEEGAEVELCTENPYAPVLDFRYCDYITVRGFTCGHHVEPGVCSGSVISGNAVYDLTVDDCHLYGCGTYGVELYDAYRVQVTDTEIYECSYGAVDVNNSSFVSFTDCSFHDNKEYNVISLYNTSNASFYRVLIKDNVCPYGAMIYSSGGDGTIFLECSFENNQTQGLHDGDDELTFDDCTGLE